MPIPKSDGPDIARRYQRITGLPDPSWQLFTTKWCEGQRSEHMRGLWRQHWNLMREWQAEGLLRWIGGYHWLRSDSTPRAQAEFALRLIEEQGGLREGEFWQIDWEPTHGIPLMTSDSVIEYQEILRAEIGERDITYSSDWIGDSSLDPDSRNEFHEWREAMPSAVYWHANYNTSSQPWGGWAEIERYDADVWQWTSSYRHPAIDDGNDGFDMNHIRKTEGLDRIAGLVSERPPIDPPPPVVRPPLKPVGEVTMPLSAVAPLDGPTRILDRQRPGIAQRHLIPVAEGTPDDAVAVFVNITTSSPAGPGHVQVWPGDSKTPPGTAVVNYSPDSEFANGSVIVALITAPNGVRAFAIQLDLSEVTITIEQVAYYVNAVEGAKGEPGEPGEPGAPGEPGPPGPKMTDEEVVSAVVEALTD